MSAKSDPSSNLGLRPVELRRILSEPEFCRVIFDALPLQVAVKSARPETFGQFIVWNRVAEEWLGLPAADVLGRTDFDFFPREQAEFFLAKDREVMASRRLLDVPEEAIRGRNDRLIYLHTVKTPIFEENGAPLALLVVSEDITDRRRTVDELEGALRRLQDERNLFRELLDHMPVGVFAKSARPEDFGVHVFWNRKMGELHHKSAEDVLGRTVEETFDSGQAKMFAQQDEAVLKRRVELDIPLQCLPDGPNKPRLTHSIKVPIFDSEGRPSAIVGVVEDITDRVEREAERAQALDMLRQLNSRVPGAIYRMKVDAAGVRAFTYMSERIEEIFRIPAHEFLENPGVARSSVHPDDLPRLREAEAKAREADDLFSCEYRIVARGGEIRWVHSSASRQDAVDGGSTWFGFLMDITERKRGEEALQESQERWELALSSTDAGVWDWDLRSGEMFFSERWRRMFDYSDEEVPDSPRALLEFIHPEDRTIVRSRTLDVLRRKSDLFRCEYRMRCRSGGHLWILAHAKAHFDAAGTATRMIGTLIDITERKRVEAQLVEAKTAAENASRAKGDFLAMMSHEIRTPLNGVLGFAELLGATALEPKQSEYLQTIRESGANLLHVLNDILDYSKIESGKLALDNQPAALRGIVNSAVATFRAKAAAKQLPLTCEIAADVPEAVLVDGLRLRQVLTNLISNAVKFTSSGSVRVTVETRGAANAAGGIPVRFAVADNGIGIAEEHLARLFEPFEQLDLSMARRFGGTGLGLSIVHRLIGIMGGEIHAQSTPEKGTTFIIDLTLAPAHLAGAGQAAVAAIAPEAKALSLLLVDDHPVNRRLARLMLERLGYSPDEAEDGASAVERAAGREYDVILLDIQMPGMDGYEAAQHIRRISPRTQLIALTAHAMPSDRQRSADSGMQAHLTKPIRINELREALDACSSRASQAHPLS